MIGSAWLEFVSPFFQWLLMVMGFRNVENQVRRDESDWIRCYVFLYKCLQPVLFCWLERKVRSRYGIGSDFADLKDNALFVQGSIGISTLWGFGFGRRLSWMVCKMGEWFGCVRARTTVSGNRLRPHLRRYQCKFSFNFNIALFGLRRGAMASAIATKNRFMKRRPKEVVLRGRGPFLGRAIALKVSLWWLLFLLWITWELGKWMLRMRIDWVCGGMLLDVYPAKR
jgi:hypothetical protein